MTNYDICPEDILSDFLRANLTDPRARNTSTDTDTFSATAGQTTRTVTPSSGSVSAITSITVNGTEINKWRDYFWDYQNSKVTFFTALSLNDAVIISYKYGTTDWIYSDRPDDSLSAASFPRISLFQIGGGANRLGRYDAPMESNPVFQIDVWVKRDYIATISSRKYANEYLARYLGNQIMQAFEDNESDLIPVLYNYRAVSTPRAGPYSEEYQAFHIIIEVAFKCLKIGRIEV